MQCPAILHQQADVAKLFGVTRAAVTAWEAGRNEPSFSMIADFCRTYKIRPSYLLEIDDRMDPLPGEFGMPADIPIFKGAVIKRLPNNYDLLTNIEKERVDAYIQGILDSREDPNTSEEKNEGAC